jgi:radical SAM-linked protein
LYCIRVKFIRGEELKFISHLDIMRIFERALRRSRLPIKYSEGFNPRPEMVFGLPLPVGVTSEAEYADFMMDRNISAGEFIDSLNPQMPPGLGIVTAMQRRGKNNIMASIAAALYDVSLFGEDPGFLTEADNELKRLMSLSEIIVEKKGKHGLKPVNIRPFILKANLEPNGTEDFTASHAPAQRKKDHAAVQGEKSFAAVQCEKDFAAVQCEKDFATVRGKESHAGDRREKGHYRARISMLASAGSKDNLNPRLLIEAFGDNVRSKVLYAEIHRRELYIKKGENLAVPFDE